MSGLSFLQKVVVKGDMKTSTRTHINKAPAEGSDIRVYYNGSIYPSKQFADAFMLEFQPKTVELIPAEVEGEAPVKKMKYVGESGNGLDVFEAKHFGGVETEENFIMVAAIPRTEGRLDLFRGCEYDEEGQPKQSVLTQGSSTFCTKNLIPMLESVYGVKLDKETNPFIDLKVVGTGENYDMPIRNANGSSVYRLPKAVARGDEKGTMLTVRRENIYLWAMVPTAMVEGAGEIVLSGPTYGIASSTGEGVEDTEEEMEQFAPDAQEN